MKARKGIRRVGLAVWLSLAIALAPGCSGDDGAVGPSGPPGPTGPAGPEGPAGQDGGNGSIVAFGSIGKAGTVDAFGPTGVAVAVTALSPGWQLVLTGSFPPGLDSGTKPLVIASSSHDVQPADDTFVVADVDFWSASSITVEFRTFRVSTNAVVDEGFAFVVIVP